MASAWLTSSGSTDVETYTIGKSFADLSTRDLDELDRLLRKTLAEKLSAPRPVPARAINYSNLTVLGTVDLTDRLSSTPFRHTFSGELPGELCLVTVLSEGVIDLAVVYDTGQDTGIVTTVFGASFGGFDLDTKDLVTVEREVAIAFLEDMTQHFLAQVEEHLHFLLFVALGCEMYRARVQKTQYLLGTFKPLF